MKIAIIGYGWVGKSMHKMFPDAEIYDPHLGMGHQIDVNKCDVAFICVPTPNKNKVIKPRVPGMSTSIEPGKGKLDTSIVKEVISWCKCPLIVIRSTVNPGDCDKFVKLFDKRIVMQPEYLGETPNHPFLDPKKRQFLIIGGKPKDRRKLIELYTTCYNANITIKQVSAYEAEVIKLSENKAIFDKLMGVQLLYDACEASKGKADFYTIRDAVYGDDPRFNLWWTFVYPDKRGANSKCIPKDVYAWCAWAESLGVNTNGLRALLERNKKWIKK